MAELHPVFQGKAKGDRLYWCGHELTIKSIGTKWVTAYWTFGWGDYHVKLHLDTAADAKGRPAYATRDEMVAAVKKWHEKTQQELEQFINLEHWKQDETPNV